MQVFRQATEVHTGDTVRDNLIRMAVYGTIDSRELLVDLAVDVSFDVPSGSIRVNRRSIGHIVLHQIPW